MTERTRLGMPGVGDWRRRQEGLGPVTRSSAQSDLIEACRQVFEIDRHELSVPELWQETARELGYDDYFAMRKYAEGDRPRIQLHSSSPEGNVWPRMIFDEIKEGNGQRIGRIRPFDPRELVQTPLDYARALYRIYGLIAKELENESGSRKPINVMALDYQWDDNGVVVRTFRIIAKAGPSAAVLLRDQIQGMRSAAEEAVDQDFLEATDWQFTI